jgi:hypothetical protein
MEIDDQLHLGWQAIAVDGDGEDEIAELLAETSERATRIKARNKARLDKAGEDGTIRIVAALGFWRAEPGPWDGLS